MFHKGIPRLTAFILGVKAYCTAAFSHVAVAVTTLVMAALLHQSELQAGKDASGYVIDTHHECQKLGTVRCFLDVASVHREAGGSKHALAVVLFRQNDSLVQEARISAETIMGIVELAFATQ